VLARSNKVIVSGKGLTAPVILPPDVFRPRTGPAAAPPAADSQAAPVAPQRGASQ
jgi:membrane protease subunit HflK